MFSSEITRMMGYTERWWQD